MPSITIHQQLKLRVEPDGETPFERTVKQVFNNSYGGHILQDGYPVTVLYDPNAKPTVGARVLAPVSLFGRRNDGP